MSVQLATLSALPGVLHEANYPEEAQRSFPSFYQTVICPQLCGKPDSNSTKSGVGRDGNPFEYSFELKGSTKNQAVRFEVDVSQIRPGERVGPLGKGGGGKGG